LRAACTSSERPRRRRDQHHVAGVDLRNVEDRHRRPAGTDHGDRGGVVEAVVERVQRLDVADRELA
jgi:hypothetical protein